MTFLKKLGLILGNVAGIVAGVGPIASALFPQQAPQINQSIGVFNQILAIVQQVEVIGNTLQLSGTQKLQAAIVQVGAVIRMTDLVTTHKIADQALFEKGIAGLSQASVDILNSLSSKDLKTDSVVI